LNVANRIGMVETLCHTRLLRGIRQYSSRESMDRS
jgi:hypothetical protein